MSISPAAGATGVSAMTAVLATFSEAMTAGSITAATLVLRDVANVPVSGAIVSYDSSTRVATLTPAQVLGTLKTYTATVVGGSGWREGSRRQCDDGQLRGVIHNRRPRAGNGWRLRQDGDGREDRRRGVAAIDRGSGTQSGVRTAASARNSGEQG